MKNCLSIIFFSLILSFPSQAKHQNEPYEPHNWDKFKVIGSENIPAIPLNSNLEMRTLPNAEKVNQAINDLISY